MSFDAQAQAKMIASGDRRALAQAITLVESTRADHRAQALALLDSVAQIPRSQLVISRRDYRHTGRRQINVY